MSPAEVVSPAEAVSYVAVVSPAEVVSYAAVVSPAEVASLVAVVSPTEVVSYAAVVSPAEVVSPVALWQAYSWLLAASLKKWHKEVADVAVVTETRFASLFPIDFRLLVSSMAMVCRWT